MFGKGLKRHRQRFLKRKHILNELIFIKHPFQHHFSHITAKAHIFLFFLGFIRRMLGLWGVLPKDTPRKRQRIHLDHTSQGYKSYIIQLSHAEPPKHILNIKNIVPVKLNHFRQIEGIYKWQHKCDSKIEICFGMGRKHCEKRIECCLPEFFHFSHNVFTF